jgi:hypothetical protein
LDAQHPLGELRSRGVAWRRFGSEEAPAGGRSIANSGRRHWCVSAILQRLAIRPGSGCDLAGAGLATHSATSVARAGARYHGDSYVQILPYIEQDALFKAT